MNYSIPRSGEAQQLWITDEHGNRLMTLEQVFGRLRLGGMGLGRYATNDKAELAEMFAAILSHTTDIGCQIDQETASEIIRQLAVFVVSKSLAMPTDVINSKGYSLQEKIEAVCKNGALKITNISDVMDAVDRYEDSLSSNKHRWSEGVHFENIISCLKDAICYYQKNGEFGSYSVLVEAVTNGAPVFRKDLGLGTSIGFVLFDNFLSVIQDVCEMVIMPLFKAKQLLLLKLNKKYETSSVTVASSVVLDSKGEASILVEMQLPSNSVEQFVILKHPSSKYYEWDDVPKVSLIYNDGRSEELEVSLKGYRNIGYKANGTDRINRISVKGKPLESFILIWSDTLYSKR